MAWSTPTVIVMGGREETHNCDVVGAGTPTWAPGLLIKQDRGVQGVHGRCSSSELELKPSLCTIAVASRACRAHRTQTFLGGGTCQEGQQRAAWHSDTEQADLNRRLVGMSSMPPDLLGYLSPSRSTPSFPTSP